MRRKIHIDFVEAVIGVFLVAPFGALISAEVPSRDIAEIRSKYVEACDIPAKVAEARMQTVVARVQSQRSAYSSLTEQHYQRYTSNARTRLQALNLRFLEIARGFDDRSAYVLRCLGPLAPVPPKGNEG